MTMPAPVLEVKGLTKLYGKTLAVDHVSFTVATSEIVGLVGPNGAGKTTTISAILGVLAPTEGSIRIEGKGVAEKRSEALERTNFAAVYAQVPGNLTVFQNLYIFGLMYGVSDLRREVDRLIAEFSLEPLRDVRCGLLSSGEQTRVNLAKAMVNRPRLLLLDEPTASLDPSAAEIMRVKIKDYAASGAGGVLWGFISKYLTGFIGAGFSFVPVLLGAVLLWDFSIQVMQGISVSFFEDVWARNFLNVFASPLRISEYITGFVLTGIGRSLLALAVMISLATLIFGLSVFVYGAFLALFLLILFLFGIALGIIGISIVLRLGPAAEWLVWPIPALISPFVGVFYPLSTLPRWMQVVGRLLPPSYVFTGVRAIVSKGTFSESALFAGIALSIVYIVLAYGLFAMTYRSALRTGLIARYSAENLS
jgi:ABC-2 type transport system permease protein